MQNLWGNLIPQIYKTDSASIKKATDAFDAEFEAFCAEQKRVKAEREAKKQAEEKPQSITEDIGGIPSEEVVEEAYKAFDIPQEILDAEKAGEEAAIKESKKRKSKKVTTETASDETIAF
jgi:hypothetical protein